jgi:hypothetical protein
MRTIETKVYSFSELSNEAKEKAIEKYYENENYPFLSDDLTESCKEYLKENNCIYRDIKLYYSLSNCQGDGLCFIGEIEKDGKLLKLTHNWRYYYASSVDMEFYDENGEEIEEVKELKDIYFDICNKLENEGYGIIEYRMDNEEFCEFSDENGYEYTEDGKRI